MRYAFLSGMAARENDLAAAQERIAALERVLSAYIGATDSIVALFEPAGDRFLDGPPFNELGDDDDTPWRITVGVARRLRALSTGARAALAGPPETVSDSLVSDTATTTLSDSEATGADTSPACTEAHHVVPAGSDACQCGGNRMERML